MMKSFAKIIDGEKTLTISAIVAKFNIHIIHTVKQFPEAYLGLLQHPRWTAL